MGYFTSHKLEILRPSLDGKTLQSVTQEEKETTIAQARSMNDSLSWCIDQEGSCANASKWYDSTKDMLVISKKIPGAVFKLSGNGEDAEDRWIEYFHAGRSHRCVAQIMFPEPDLGFLLIGNPPEKHE